MSNVVDPQLNPPAAAEPSNSRRVSDPQVIVMGMLKEGNRSDTIVFKVNLALFELVCIVTIPEQGTRTAPVYVKFRVNK